MNARTVVGILCVVGLALTAGLVRAEEPPSYELRENLVFSTQPEELKLDAHIPNGKGPFPAIILVHGGGWTVGDKTVSFIRPLFPILDRTGFAWFSIDYRLAPKYPYTAAVEDVELALQYVKSHAKEFKVRKDRIALMGESAGAHLVNMVGAKNKKPNDVAAVVSFYGPVNLADTLRLKPGGPLSDNLKAVFQIAALDEAGLAKVKAGSPDTHFHKKSAPFLFIHGTNDDPVPYAQSPLGVKLLTELGVQADLITVQDGIHGVINWEKEPRFHTYKQPMIDWLLKRLK